LIIADAESRDWKSENAYLQILPELIAHAKRNGTVLSLGASYRSANIFDSCDAAQIAEIEYQALLAREIRDQGAQVIIESPGHARPREIRKIAALLRATGFPVMPLGPIPTDTAVAQDHIASAIGATLLGLEGCAHILAAVTREEHTGGVPSLGSTLEAVAAAQVAAHIIDLDQLNDEASDLEIALGRSRGRTCIITKQSRGCDRCVKACPL
jgi:phosphomethylpyrimidine synthase